MSGMEKISEAILSKVGDDARGIVAEAEEKAKQEVEKAQQQRQGRIEEEKGRKLQEAEEKAARVRAQASIKAHQELLVAKSEVIDKIVAGVKKKAGNSSSEEGLLNLIREAVDGLDVNEAMVYVAHRDMATAQKIIKSDKKLSSVVKKVSEIDCTGGAVVGRLDGKLRIDNTYDTRLEMLLPKILPEVSRNLFEGL